jgi:hypothetical protein
MLQDPHHVYLDLDVINNDFTANGTRPYLRFEEIRNTPFLDGDSAEYFCSIVRFTMQTGNTLPVFIPSIVLNQADPNLTIYKVTLTFQGTIVTRNVVYWPEDNTAPVPASPLTTQDISSTYYYVFNYSHFVEMVNAALKTAFNDLRTLVTPAVFDVIPTVAPYLDFDITTNRVILRAEQKRYDETFITFIGGGVPAINIFFNERLFDLFTGMQYTYEIKQGDINYRLRVAYNGGNLVARNVITGYDAVAKEVTYTTINYVQMFQEVSSIALWNPVASILFTSALLPIKTTQTSLPRNIGSREDAFANVGNNSNLISAISDFSIAVDGNNQYRPMVVYNPSAEYRLIDMNSCMNLNRVDIIVYWKDKFGNMHPFELNPGNAASVKIMFRRKDFNTTA